MWQNAPKPTELAETRLIEAILSGAFPINSHLPAERELAKQLGITRPTLREVLQRLARDGWVEIAHGKTTRVRDYWREGKPAVLSAIAQFPEHSSPKFVENLLQVRNLLAPTYVRMAVENDPDCVVQFLRGLQSMEQSAESFAQADFQLHRTMAIASGNPAFTLTLNAFAGTYEQIALTYFAYSEAQIGSREFYAALLRAAKKKDAAEAEAVTQFAMNLSVELWNSIANRETQSAPNP